MTIVLICYLIHICCHTKKTLLLTRCLQTTWR
ncbi:KP93L [African swine fever virus]|nr:KP93L [African swine fever virus]